MNVEKHWRAPGWQAYRQDTSVEPPWDDLDPGIRETVRWLWRAGFHPRDSGDGVTKPVEHRSIEGPHVFMVTVDGGDLVAECDRLQVALARMGVHITHDDAMATVEGSYDPANGVGLITLRGVDDAMLGLIGTRVIQFDAPSARTVR